MATTSHVLAALGLLAALGAPQAHAAYPEEGRAIRIVIGFTAGGATDGQARAVAQRLSGVLKTPVIVDNRPGASTIVATTTVIRAQPDGYTLLYSPSSTVAQNPHTLLQADYDPFKDLTPISLAARGPLVLVAHESTGARTVAQLVDYVKANPGKLSYASFGTGTSSHIIGEMFARKNGLDITHVPYKGGADAARDLLSGRVTYMFDAAPNAITAQQTGRAHLLAVPSAERSSTLPDVPTLTEAGVQGLALPSWMAFYGPPGLPPDVVQTLNRAIGESLQAEEVARFFQMGAYTVSPSTPEALTQITRETYDLWGKVIQDAGIEKQ